jgi:NAD-dependent deacetylase
VLNTVTDQTYDFTNLTIDPFDLDRVADLVRASERMSVFTGAGISTESGIPDYRGPNGVWARNAIPHIDTIRTDREARVAHWQERRRHYPTMLAREPNAGHLAVAEFEAGGQLLAVITQNIDGLHQKAGNSPDRVIELHGSTHVIRCTQNGHTFSGVEVQARLDAGEEDPHCPECGSVLRGGTILFGEALPEQALRTAHAVSRATDLMVVVGSSLVVNPAARLPVIAKDNGARIVMINQAPTPLDEIADIRIAGPAGAALSGIADRVFREG